MSAPKGLTRADKLDIAQRRARGESLTAIAAAHGVDFTNVRHHLEWREPWRPKPCGTSAAYRRHLRAGERPCPKCCAANAAATKTYKRKAEAA